MRSVYINVSFCVRVNLAMEIRWGKFLIGKLGVMRHRISLETVKIGVGAFF